MTANAKAAPLTLRIQTLSGEQFCLEGLTLQSTVLDAKRLLAEQLDVPPDTLNFLRDSSKLDVDSATLAEAALKAPEDTLVLIRTVGSTLNQALLMAISEGRDQDAIKLIDLGAGLDSRGCPVKEVESTILHLAIRASMKTLALHLITSGADINATNEMGRQPLAVATIKGMSEVVESLIHASADLRHQDSNRMMPMHYEIRNKRLDPAVRLMLNAWQHSFLGQDIT
jgi:ankyrin repeat protein